MNSRTRIMYTCPTWLEVAMSIQIGNTLSLSLDKWPSRPDAQRVSFWFVETPHSLLTVCAVLSTCVQHLKNYSGLQWQCVHGWGIMLGAHFRIFRCPSGCNTTGSQTYIQTLSLTLSLTHRVGRYIPFAEHWQSTPRFHPKLTLRTLSCTSPYSKGIPARGPTSGPPDAPQWLPRSTSTYSMDIRARGPT